jgi:opacity protein-like surface antigen
MASVLVRGLPPHALMKRLLLAILVLAAPAATDATAQMVSAEPWLKAGTWIVSAEFGGAAFSDFQRTLAQPPAGSFDVPKFERRISAGTSSTVGASVTRWISNNAAVRGGVAYTPSRFTVWNDDLGQRALDAYGDGEARRTAKLGVWHGSATLVFRLPLHLGRVLPYGVAGAGAVHYRVLDNSEIPPEARRRFADGRWTAPAAVFGVGTTLPLQRNNLLMTFELTNHLVRTPLNDEGAGEWFEISGVPLQLTHEPRTAGDAIGVTSNLRLTVGLSLPVRPRAAAAQ